VGALHALTLAGPLALAASLLLAPSPAAAQLEQETVARDLDLRRAQGAEARGPFEVKSFKGRYRYEVESFRRLIPLAATMRRCVEAQRVVSGEFHARLDFELEPSGKLKSFACRGHEQLQACLLPHALALRFAPFREAPGFTLQVLVASPGVQLGRRVEAKPIGVYPVGTEEEQRAYKMAAGWVLSPWSQAISHCAELTDQTLGFGYQVALELPLSRGGRAERARLQVTGKLASRAVDSLAACIAPFVKAIEAPPHSGSQPVLYRMGTRTAGWGIR